MSRIFARRGTPARLATSALSRSVLLAAVVAGGATTAWAQGTPAISNPTPLGARPPETKLHTMLAVPALRAPAPAEAREVTFDLTVDYTKSELRNPTTGRDDPVNLRSYLRPPGTDQRLPYVAPLIELYPGQTVRVTLHNKLTKDPTCPVASGSANVPHCFNGTNLHSHGLWINPSGNGDNVTISINPGVDFQYEYNVPPDHPAGTFWYHSHRHGSTALQVSSGMAGPMIVRGRRPPTADGHGDLDTLLRPIASQSFTERVMVFQQIQYACRYPADDPDTNIRNKIKRNADGTYFCDPKTNDVGGVEDYDEFGPRTWPKSGRFTSINGAVLGRLDPVAEAGKIERWRMIHGGVRDTISLQLRKRADAAGDPVGLTAATAQQYVDTNCTGAPLQYFLVAGDGLTKAAATPTQVAVFQPGYRWDALVVFPEPGDYCMLDEASTASASVNQNFRPTQLLGTVHVAGGTPVTADPTAYLKTQLKAAADVNMPAGEVRDTVKKELDDGLKLTSFVPHADIDSFTGTQKLTFNITGNPINGTFFEIDGQPYDHTRIDRTLMLGGVDEWTLTSLLASHPFHIHVNPFQVVKIIAPDGQTDVSVPGAVDDFAIKNGQLIHDPTAIDPQYPGLKGVWKDTLFVKNIGGGTQGVYTVVVRTRYERYIGDFVLHCHILDHEDQGMMQNIRIAVPDAPGGVASAHH